MIKFKDFITEAEARVKVGDEVEVHYKKMNGDTVSRGKHKVTKVGVNHFEIDREGEDGKPMKFNHNGYGKDYTKSGSGRVKGLSRTYGHVIKSLQEAVSDVQQIKRKRLNDRTPKQQAAVNAAKQSKAPKGKVEVHLVHENGAITKGVFKLTKSPAKWKEEAEQIADSHLKHMQQMHDQFPKLAKEGERPASIHKVVVK